MAAIFFQYLKSIQNLHFFVEKMFECFISNIKLVLAYFFSFKNMKNNKSSQNLDTGYHYIKYGWHFTPCKYIILHIFSVEEQTNL